MKYADKTFSVAAPGTDEYRENWDRIFGPKPAAKDAQADAQAEDLPRYAPEGYAWICSACRKTQPFDLYAFADESCVLNAVLVKVSP